MPASISFEPFILDGLCGRPVDWTALDGWIDEFAGTCGEQGVAPLLYHRLKATEALNGVPKPLRRRLMARAVAAETLRSAIDGELFAIIETLATAGIIPLLLKGNALAHSIYSEPHLRLGSDSDFLVRSKERDAARSVLLGIGYEEANVVTGELVMNQTALSRSLPGGLRHVVDLHWELRNTPILSGLLSPDELCSRARALPSLGKNAWGPSLPDSCLIASMNRATDRGFNRLIWLYDFHLIVENLGEEEARQLVGLAGEKKVRAICLDAIEAARQRFQSRLPEGLLEGLSEGRPFAEEMSARLLTEKSRAGRMLSDLRAVPGWRKKARLLKQHFFPPPDYMLRRHSTGLRLLLPFLYLRRIIQGIAKMWH